MSRARCTSGGRGSGSPEVLFQRVRHVDAAPAFGEAGGFDEDLFCYSEDTDLFIKIRLLGYRCVWPPRPSCITRGRWDAGHCESGKNLSGGAESDRHIVALLSDIVDYLQLVIFRARYMFLMPALIGGAERNYRASASPSGWRSVFLGKAEGRPIYFPC